LKDPVWEERIRELKPDLILSMYYRNMIPTRLLNLAPLGAYNMHGSFLPRYRGRAPLNWAIINGEDHTGVSLHVMVKEADAGEVVDQEKVFIGPEETAAAVLPRIREAAVKVLGRQLAGLLSGTAPRTPQDHSLATYFGKRTPEDGRIDWTKSAREIFNLVRALSQPFPGAFTDILIGGKTARLMIWKAVPLPATPGAIPPGQVLKILPLTISCGKQESLLVTDFEWVDTENNHKHAAPHLLQTGDSLIAI
jgi:methionyl-tRNA formyltransferase